MTDYVISSDELEHIMDDVEADKHYKSVRSRPLSEAMKQERERVLKQIVTAMSNGEQCPHNFCINDQMNCVDCWWQWVESLRSEQP